MMYYCEGSVSVFDLIDYADKKGFEVFETGKTKQGYNYVKAKVKT